MRNIVKHKMLPCYNVTKEKMSRMYLNMSGCLTMISKLEQKFKRKLTYLDIHNFMRMTKYSFSPPGRSLPSMG